jgi:DNA primase
MMMYERVLKACRYILKHDAIAKEAQEYLDTRLSRKLQDQYEFGFFPADDDLEYLFSLVGRERLEQENIVYKKWLASGTVLHGHFADHNLVMPFRDIYGNIIALLGRCLLSDERQKELCLQKYKYSFESNKDLFVFGLDKAWSSIIEKDCVIGVEGQFDCIACHAEGITNVVAFGWANLSRYQMFQLHRYTNNIILMLDKDEAGISSMSRIKRRFSPFANIETVSLPSGYKDIDEFLRKETDTVWRQTVIDGLKNLRAKERNGSKKEPIR